jgi:hypothetical protein
MNQERLFKVLLGPHITEKSASATGSAAQVAFKVATDASKLEVKGNIAELLLDVTDNFTLSGGGERVTTLSEDLHEVVGELTASQVQTEDGMGESVTLIDGDGVGNTITRVHDNTSGTTRGIEGEDSLDGNIHGGHVEGLEHDLSHLLTVSLGVKRSLSQEDGLFLRGNTEFIVESVMPDLLHVIPVGDDTVFNGVFEGEDTSLGLGFISDVGVLLTHTDHHTLVPGTADDGREDSPGGIITSETSLAHAGAIVNDESSNVLISHFGFVLLKLRLCHTTFMISSINFIRIMATAIKLHDIFIR